jgi:hypothetical protein
VPETGGANLSIVAELASTIKLVPVLLSVTVIVLLETAVTMPAAAGGVPCLKPEVVAAVVELAGAAACVCMAIAPAVPPIKPRAPNNIADFLLTFIVIIV